ncbi:MAG: sigma-70 family RNA polymerase sigma factor [Nakamurella sp.]
MGGRRGSGSSEVGVLFEQHHTAIWRYLAGRVGATHADDLAAETFLLAIRRWHTYDPDRGPVIAWLFGIATLTVRSHARDEQRHLRRVQAMAAAQVDAPPADETIDRLDAQRRLQRLVPDLLQLDPTDRDILLLMAWAGLAQVQVAEALGLLPVTVRSRLHRARRRLRRAEQHLQVATTRENGLNS